eukprot:CAMPEP_0206143670 /NCGR_PEP_ID=MMETSP1473-20131121/21397_1 /ASSEMBLY_ACC=CAM_ASM_001109 /TAXON_ID=1461547 /ORGANISM="Stichococcus sp, Strain RCC1054" /LENGTH=842 /DNA_ID=CAMNT_0053539177 /DNA_START=163 /DNA_END=2691 /DNA_ORIENTATION=+
MLSGLPQVRRQALLLLQQQDACSRALPVVHSQLARCVGALYGTYGHAFSDLASEPTSTGTSSEDSGSEAAVATPSGSAPKQQMAPSHAASGGVGWTPAAKVQERSAAARAAGQIEVRQGALDRGRPFAQGHSQRSNVRPDPVTATEQAEADALVEAYNLPDDVIAAAEQNNSELPEDIRQKLLSASYALQQLVSERLANHQTAEVVRVFTKHMDAAVMLAAKLKAPLGSSSIFALRPKYTAFKAYMVALRFEQPRTAMKAVEHALNVMHTMGLPLDDAILLMAIYCAYDPNRNVKGKDDTPSKEPADITSEDAQIVTRLMAKAMSTGHRPNGQCYYHAITIAACGRELTACAWLVRHLASEWAVVYESDIEGLQSCLTRAMLGMSRTGRLDDAGDVMAVAEKLGTCITAGALQAILPYLVEHLRGDLLLIAIENIASQTSRLGASEEEGAAPAPMKMDEGTLVAILNVAASTADVKLAHVTWGLLKRSLAQATPWDTRSPTSKAAAAAASLRAATHPTAGDAPPELSLHPFDDGPDPGREAREALELARQLNTPPYKRHPEPESEETAREKVLDELLHQPCVPAYHALIHTFAKAGHFEDAMRVLARLEKGYAFQPGVAAWYGQQSFVDAISPSVNLVDAAYFAVEGLHAKGEEVTTAMLNIIIAACAQVGDLTRAFETFEAAPGLGLKPDADSYNALMLGCVRYGQNDSAPKLLGEMRTAGLEPNVRSIEIMVDSAVVAADCDDMMACLQELADRGTAPSINMLQRCVERAERSGDAHALKLLMARLDTQNYKIIGAAAKMRRWEEEGGIRMLVGGDRFVSRPMSGGYRHPDKMINTRRGH